MRLGLSSYTYVWAIGVPGYAAPRHPLTPLGLLDKASALKVGVVQLADNLPLHRLNPAERRELRREAEVRKISLEVGTAGIVEDNLRAYLAIAAEMGSPILRTVLDLPGDHPTPAEAVARLAPILPDFEAAGVTLAIENHDRFPAETLRRLVLELESAAVGVCLDTANSLGCLEGIEPVVETLGRQTVNLHLKDVCAFRPAHLKGFVVEGRPAGRGQLDFPWILHRLRTLGADPNAIIELWPPPAADAAAAAAREDAWATESVQYLRQFIST